jgi:transcriptional regulator with XRE-family HTH domain
MEASWFAGRLKELREAAGLTQPDLAGRAGLTKDGIAQLETGRREPAWRTVVAICQALGVEPGEFLKEPRARPATGRGRPRKAADEREPGPARGQKKRQAKKGQ